MDTITLDPRLRYSSDFLGRNPLMLIDGKQVPAASGKTFVVYNPATGGVIANVPEGGWPSNFRRPLMPVCIS